MDCCISHGPRPRKWAWRSRRGHDEPVSYDGDPVFSRSVSLTVPARMYSVIATNPTIDRITGKISDQSLLFQYTIKLVLIVSFSELILYRLPSPRGAPLSP